MSDTRKASITKSPSAPAGPKADPVDDAPRPAPQAAVDEVASRASSEPQMRLGESLFPEQVALLAARNLEALVACSGAATRAAQELAGTAVEFGQRNARQASAALHGLSEARSAPEFVALQSEYARNLIEEMAEATMQFGDRTMRLFGEVVEPLVAHVDASGAMPSPRPA